MAVSALKRVTGNRNASFVLCDFLSEASIRSCAKEIMQQVDRLDILVLNAGIAKPPTIKEVGRGAVADIWMTNHIGSFLFANELMPLIATTATKERDGSEDGSGNDREGEGKENAPENDEEDGERKREGPRCIWVSSGVHTGVRALYLLRVFTKCLKTEDKNPHLFSPHSLRHTCRGTSIGRIRLTRMAQEMPFEPISRASLRTS